MVYFGLYKPLESCEEAMRCVVKDKLIPDGSRVCVTFWEGKFAHNLLNHNIVTLGVNLIGGRFYPKAYYKYGDRKYIRVSEGLCNEHGEIEVLIFDKTGTKCRDVRFSVMESQYTQGLTWHVGYDYDTSKWKTLCFAGYCSLD